MINMYAVRCRSCNLMQWASDCTFDGADHLCEFCADLKEVVVLRDSQRPNYGLLAFLAFLFLSESALVWLIVRGW